MSSFERTPPKSSDRLRTGLESLRREDQPEPGAGLQPGEEIPVAAFHDPAGAKLYQELLLHHGLFSSMRRHEGQTQVLVDAADRERAAELLQTHLQQHPDKMREGFRRPFDFAIFGTLIAGAIGFAAMAGQFNAWRPIALCLLFCLIGFLTGLFIDRSRYKRWARGRWQFTIGDLLAVMAIFSLFWLLWRLLTGK